jgi:hypothetical protein
MNHHNRGQETGCERTGARANAWERGWRDGAGEGNRTLVTGKVVSSGSEWPYSLGIPIEAQVVSCITCTKNN